MGRMQNFFFFYITPWRVFIFFYIDFEMAAGAPRGGRAGCMDHACGFFSLCAAANRRDGR